MATTRPDPRHAPRGSIAVVIALAVVAAACSGGGSTESTRAPLDTIAVTDTTHAGAPRTSGDDRSRDEGERALGGEETAPATTEVPAASIIAGDAPASEPEYARLPDPPRDTRFDDAGVNPFVDPARDELSTFAVDVDTGSYTLMRAWVSDGFLPHPEAVRVEEFVNYFDGGYESPRNDTFAVYADGGPTPFWDRRNDIVRIGIKAREVAERRRQDLNLTLVVDVSGSMGDQGKLDTVKDALEVLVGELDGLDTVAVVAYNTNADLILRPTPGDDTRFILDAIDELEAGGSTNAEAGLLLGYDLADDMFRSETVNRVVLLSDGVANVGNTGPEAILERIGDEARRGIDLVTIGVGISTYNDVLLEQLADQGDGWYAYVDTYDEAVRLFREQLTTSLETVARDVKVQVEFDPDLVEEYRLIGFENRDLDDRDFRDDEVDAGDINAGHTVTALYEVALTRDAYRSDDTFATVRLRWIDAADGRSHEIEGDISTRLLADRFDDTEPRFQVAATVAAYAEVLRDSRWVRGLSLDDLLDEARFLPVRDLDDPAIDEFIDLLELAAFLAR